MLKETTRVLRDNAGTGRMLVIINPSRENDWTTDFADEIVDADTRGTNITGAVYWEDMVIRLVIDGEVTITDYSHSNLGQLRGDWYTLKATALLIEVAG